MNIIKNIIASSLILAFFVAPVFVSASALDDEYDKGVIASKYNDTDSNKTVSLIVIKVISWLLRILAALAVMVLIIAGMMYILSGGDEGKASTAKTWILYAIIGLIIALLGWVIVNLATQLVKTGS